jgi:hypothetical protein
MGRLCRRYRAKQQLEILLAKLVCELIFVFLFVGRAEPLKVPLVQNTGIVCTNSNLERIKSRIGGVLTVILG